MDIDSRYPIRHRLPPGGSGERAGDYINLGLGLSPLPQREKQRTIYSLDHARSGSNLRSASASPLSFRSRHLPAVLDYCLDRNDFHGVSRAEGPGQLTWMSVSENHAVFGTLGDKVCAVRVLRPCVQAGRNSIKLACQRKSAVR